MWRGGISVDEAAVELCGTELPLLPFTEDVLPACDRGPRSRGDETAEDILEPVLELNSSVPRARGEETADGVCDLTPQGVEAPEDICDRETSASR